MAAAAGSILAGVRHGAVHGLQNARRPICPLQWNRSRNVLPSRRGSRGEVSVHCSLQTASKARLPVPRLNGSLVCRGAETDVALTVPADPETQSLIEEVKGVLEREHPSLPLGVFGRDDDALIWWFLKDRKLQVDPAVAKLAKAIRWRNEFGVANLTLEKVAEEAATGKAYLHDSPAMDGRPVIVVAAAKHFPDSKRLVASQQLCAFLIEQALDRLPPSEEQFLGIFDLRGFTAWNGDIKFVGFLIDVFFNYYPKRLHKVLFVDAPPIFLPGWRLMKPMLKSYASLVEFCSADDVRDKYFAPGKAPSSFL